MKKIRTLFLFLCLFFVAHATTVSVTSTAGDLSSAITGAGADLATVTNLTVTGTIDARDFKTMRDDMPLLAVLDLGGATIAEYTGVATNGSMTYPANGIPHSAFYLYNPSDYIYNTSLTSIIMPSTLTSIGDYAFSSCRAFNSSLAIPKLVTSIGIGAFYGCSGFTGSLTIPESVTSIANNAFQFCSGFTGSLTIPKFVTSIGYYAFGGCSGFTGSLTIPTFVTRIGVGAFQDCTGFTGSLTIPKSVTSIEYTAFARCSGFTGSLTIPSTSIGGFAFEGCTGFTGSLTIPSSVTSIERGAFWGCNNISAINAHSTTPRSIVLRQDVFYGIPTGISLHVSPGTKALYEAADQWNDFRANIVEDLANAPAVTTTAASSITSGGAILNGSINANIASTVVTFEYGLTSSYGTTVTAAQSPVTGITDTAVSYGLSGLTLNTTYHYRINGVNSEGTTYGDDMTFTTLDPRPTVTSLDLTSIRSGTATGNGDISYLGESDPTAYGVCWNTKGNPTTADYVTDNGGISTTGAFTAAMTGLTAKTTYYVRAYATNTAGTSYGDEVTFSTTDIAPNISYATPQNYSVGMPIAALTPTNTGGAVPASAQVSTFAGSGSQGSADGVGTAASFHAPRYLTLDALGTIYVSDYQYNLIRKITPASNVSTLIDASASTQDLAGLAVDATGNVYVVDTQNHRILKVSSAGVVTTLAGSDIGELDNVDGVGIDARFSAPSSIAIDASNNLYVADTGNNSIRKITPAGVVTTLAGSGTADNVDGTGTAAKFNRPMDLTVDTSGNLYVADTDNNSIRKITPAGVVTTLADADGAPIADFNQPMGITVDASNNLYVVETGNNSIRKITPAGVVTTLTDANGAPIADFNQPMGITVDAFDNLYVADTGNNLIRKITQATYTCSPALPAGLSFNEATGVISGTPTSASAATTYTITTANNGGSSTAIVSIAVKNPQTIMFGTLATKIYGDATFDLAATSTSGLAVSYTSDNTAVATVSGTTVTIVGAGTANITASQAGDATYVAATNVIQQLTVSKKVVTVTAANATKVYDGTTASTVIPTVGSLAAGDAINVIPTQAFDDASVGTTHVLSASGLSIKNGSTDVTSNYDISYVPATGTINKLAVTVSAANATKVYDGTTVSTVIPTVGTLASGDAINGIPTQAFDDASVGTTHVLSASGLSIKHGSTDVTSNYAISYVPATGTINKLAVTVTAANATKVYDGTTVSTAVPTVGTLAAGDAINGIPTQAFDDASVGTTHVLSASGLSIKNGSTDVTSNYAISYVPATGTINKLAVTVSAANATKVYDGTTVSTVIPTVGTLAAGDAINVAPTQAFDDASVGTTHVLSASGLSIKHGSTDVTSNYAISYVPANGSITAKALTITAPTVTRSKVYDGNTVAAVTTGTLSGVVASDAGKVAVTAVATYDNAKAGTNKTITVLYTVAGSAAGNYSSPADFIATGAEISSGNIVLEPLSNPAPNPTNNDMVLSYNVIAGGPTQYQISFEAAALAVGIQNVSYTALATTGADGSIFIAVPKGTRPGKYKGALTLKNDSGVESKAYDFVLTVNIPTEYIAVKYNRVLVLDNSTRIFSAYQWYKDGIAIEGATKQFYRDPKGLVGTYSVQASTTDAEVLYSFPKVLNIPLIQKVTAYPTMVKASQVCTVEITDEAMELDLTGAEISVYSTQGICVYHSTKVERLNTIKLPIINGVYSGRLTTTDGQSFLFKVIVAN